MRLPFAILLLVLAADLSDEAPRVGPPSQNVGPEAIYEEEKEYDSVVLMEGCGMTLSHAGDDSCQKEMIPTGDTKDCKFSTAGLALIIAGFSRAVCPVTGLTMMTSDGEDIAWSIAVQLPAGKKAVDAGVSGYLSFSNLQLPKTMGVDLHKLGFPKVLKDVGFGAAKTGKKGKEVTWLAMKTTMGKCTIELLKKTDKAKPKNSGIMAGLTCEDLDFLNVLKNNMGVNFALDFLKDTTCTVLYTSMEIEPFKDVPPVLANAQLEIAKMKIPFAKQSVGFVAAISKPDKDKCSKKDFICLFLKEIMQDDKPMILSGMKMKDGVRMYGAIPLEIELSKKVTMKDVVLMVDTTAKGRGMYVQLSLQLNSPELLFTGGVGQLPGGLELKAEMLGIWENAFGIPNCALADVKLGATFIPSLPPLAYQLGAKVLLGKKPKKGHNDERITATAYCGINTVAPEENYFYAFVRFTLQGLLRAFGNKKNLPNFMKDTGFPDGVTLSFTANPFGKIIEATPEDITIKPGLGVKGRCNFLGANAYMELELNMVPLSMLVKIQMPEIKIGNVVKLTGKDGKGLNGMFKIDTFNPMATKAEFQGTIQLLGLKRYAYLSIDVNNFKLRAGDKIFKVWRSEITVQGSYGNMAKASFSAHIMVKQDLARLIGAVRGALLAKLREGKKKVKQAQDKVKKERKNCEKKLKANCNKCAKKLGKICNKIEKVCKKGKCNLKTKKKKRKKCRKNCERKCDDCKRKIRKGCGAVCKGINAVAKGMCSSMDAASYAVKGTAAAYGGIIKVSVGSLRPEQILNIKQIDFDAKIGTGNPLGKLGVKIQMTVIKKSYTFGGKVDIYKLAKNDVGSFFNDLFKKIKNKF